MFSSVYALLTCAVLWLVWRYNFPFFEFFFTLGEGCFFCKTSSACHLNMTPPALRFSTKYSHWEEFVFIDGKTGGDAPLNRREILYYSSLRWKIPYASSINQKHFDISHHHSTKMFILGNAQHILMRMFRHHRKYFFLCKMSELFLT